MQMFDLLLDCWLPIQRKDGSRDLIRPCDIADSGPNPPLELLAPRADFRAALYQLLIGLLQTAFAPQDENAWRSRFVTPPSAEELAAAFALWADVFALDNPGGPAFAQDLDPLTAPELKANLLPLRNLLIDAGSDSNSYFNKPSDDEGFCPSCTAQALFTLQTNAPAGGRGIRTSVRGGGPLSTLVTVEGLTLWQQLWLNVLPLDVLGHDAPVRQADVIPWLAATRNSEDGRETSCGADAHPLQAYWGLPRRIRLDTDAIQPGVCAVCGQPHERLYTRYRTRHGGVNYAGAWLHPLSPYNRDAKQEKPPLPVKGMAGGVAYRHWLGMVLGSDDGLQEPAKVAQHFRDHREPLITRHLQRPGALWACGYRMDNAKAVAWNDSRLPLYRLPAERWVDFRLMVGELLQIAEESAVLLARAVREAWGSESGDPAVAQGFWQQSEAGFYQRLAEAVALPDCAHSTTAPLFKRWLEQTRQLVLRQFDDWTRSILTELADTKQMLRVIEARAELEKKLRNNKPFKNTRQWVGAELAAQGAEA